MPSVQVFERMGFDVTPAPTLLSTRGDGNYSLLSAVVPSARALNTTVVCLHEYLGMLWYAIYARPGRRAQSVSSRL